jgi:hypothetical protein
MNGQQLNKLRRIISIAEELITFGAKPTRARRGGSTNGTLPAKRLRRSGKELAQFRKMLKTQRKRGIPVAELARKHGVSSGYVYMIG